jgi:hypothetical protein
MGEFIGGTLAVVKSFFGLFRPLPETADYADALSCMYLAVSNISWCKPGLR